ncbi:MAG: hypothetical protein WB867_02390 [Candidatus Dormiibacterota bacterium]
MSAFGAVPGLTIITLASVMVMGFAYLAAATYISWSDSGHRHWKVATLPVLGLFALTTCFALIAAIAENQFVTRVTGG